MSIKLLKLWCNDFLVYGLCLNWSLHFLALLLTGCACPWVRHLTSPRLSFLAFKMGCMIIIEFPWGGDDRIGTWLLLAANTAHILLFLIML